MSRARTLTPDQIEHIHERAEQINGILDCVAAASKADLIPDECIPAACWAANTLLAQMLQIVTGEEVTHGA